MDSVTNTLYERGLEKYDKYKEDMKTSNAGVSILNQHPKSRIPSYYFTLVEASNMLVKGYLSGKGVEISDSRGLITHLSQMSITNVQGLGLDIDTIEIIQTTQFNEEDDNSFIPFSDYISALDKLCYSLISDSKKKGI